jgi:signal transduction histidine kinase
MLYVTVGLSVMFGVLAFLGLGAIDQATQLVFAERLSTASTTASMVEGGFARIADDVQELSLETSGRAGAAPTVGIATALLDHFDRVSPSPYFRVTGVWLLSGQGVLLDEAGSPTAAAVMADRVRAIPAAMHTRYAVLQSLGPVPGAVAFAAVAVRVGAAGDGPVIVVHTVSRNSQADYVPADYGGAGAPAGSPSASSPTAAYHLEVVDPAGIAILGIGPDEQPGLPSVHYPMIKGVMARGAAAAMIHEPGPTDSFAPHVMAVVPLPSSPFYVVIEQPIDVALALPDQLREQLILTTALGFLAALVVAWVTTRHVVKPTEQLTSAAGRMAQGDLTTPIEVSAQDEVGKLAESLDAMRQRLQAAYGAIEQTNRELEGRVAERTARLGQLLRQTINAQEDERRRLARELHDETAQTLAALSIALDRARDELGGGPAAATRRIREAREIAGRLLADTRRMILGLRPAVLDDMGLLAAIRWYSESYLSDRGVEVVIEADQPLARLPSHLEVALFRIVQEAITNVAKHADARHVRIHLGVQGGTMTVSVSDDGRGFDLERALGQTGPGNESVGLLGMQERVRLLNGHLAIRSERGAGTTVTMEAPVSEEVA